MQLKIYTGLKCSINSFGVNAIFGLKTRNNWCITRGLNIDLHTKHPDAGYTMVRVILQFQKQKRLILDFHVKSH